MAKVDAEEWGRLWTGIRELCEHFPDGIVFIGGIAVYLHVKDEALPENFVEFSHDGDFYLSLSDFSDLRDLEEVTANRRLNKHQIIKHGIDFDIYLEGHNHLIVKFADAMADSTVIDQVRVACLEHLLLLKLDAFADRRGSAKGGKDERDLIKICVLLDQQGLTPKRLSKYLTRESVELLWAVKKSAEFMTICAGNAHQARGLRESFHRVVARVDKLAKSTEPAAR